MKKTALFIIIMLLSLINTFAQSHSISDKTLFVELFGSTIFNNTQRELDLLQYAQNNGYKNLILKGIPNIKTGSGLTAFLIRKDVNTSSTQSASLEAHLAGFLNAAHTTYGIKIIGAGDDPYETDISGSYVHNYFFDNINEFNIRSLANPAYNVSGPNPLYPKNFCFDMIYVEQDYWKSGEPTPNVVTNFTDYYEYGIQNHVAVVRNNSAVIETLQVAPLITRKLILGTYLDDLGPVATATVGAISAQNQVNFIDQYVDWVFLTFYFKGNNVNQPSPTISTMKAFFYNDYNNGNNNSRLLLFASNTYPSIILPLFAASASYSPNANFFGDYLKSSPTRFAIVASSPTKWNGTVEDAKSQFDTYCSGITNNPLNNSVNQSVNYQTVTNVVSPYVGNDMTYGVGWFKYGVMPNSPYYINMPPDDLNVGYTPKTISPTENISSTSSIHSNTTNCVNCLNNDITNKPVISATVNNYRWYNDQALVMDPQNTTFPLSTATFDAPIQGSTEHIFKFEIEADDPNAVGFFRQLKIRREVSFTGSYGVGINDPYWYINNIDNPTCPSFNNGQGDVIFQNQTVTFYRWHNNTDNSNHDTPINSSTVTGLTAGNYTITPYCGSNPSNPCYIYNNFQHVWYYPSTQLTIYGASINSTPEIISGNSKYNCDPNLRTDEIYSQYQWKFNGLNIPSFNGGTNPNINVSNYGNGTYTVTVSNGVCSLTSSPYFLKMNPTPIISGSNITCDANKSYIVSEDPNNSNYTWTVPNGATFTPNVNSIIVNWGTAASTGGIISCTVSNTCGRSTTANITVNGCCNSASGDLNNPPAITTSQTFYGTFHINGTLQVSNGAVLTINGADISMNKDAKIIVGAYSTLRIINASYLHSCGNDMWNGIELAAATSNLEIIGHSIIEDAVDAIYSMHGGKFQLNGAVFNANYRHIHLLSTVGYNLSYIENGCQFTCKNNGGVDAYCLKAPYSGQRTKHAILLENVNGFSFGNSSYTNNTISNSETGIESRSSQLTINNFNLYGCNIGIYALNDGTLTAHHNNFECSMGVMAKYGANLNVYTNNFVGGEIGVSAQLNKKANFQIHHNFFHNQSNYGVLNVGNFACTHNIYNNTILNERDNQSFGIDVSNYDTDQSLVDIFSNDIHNVAFGIHLNNIVGGHIHGNIPVEVINTEEPRFLTYGINVENCRRSLIENNTVTSFYVSQQEHWWSNGIMADISSESSVLCNYVYNIGRGLWFGGFCPNSIVAGNIMGDCYDQLYLYYNLIGLNDQGADPSIVPPDGLAYDNEWQGSPYSAGNGHQTTAYFSNDPNSPGYTNFYTRSGSTYEPTDNYVYPNTFNQCAVTVLSPYSANSYCSVKPGTPEDIRVEKSIANNDYNFGTTLEPFEWMSKQYLLNRTKEDINLENNNPDILAAKIAIELSNIGKLDALKDSIITVEVDSVSVAELLQLQQINNGLQPTVAVEANYKSINKIYLNYVKLKTFSTVQVATMRYLANLCPYVGGPAVYMSRTLLKIIDNTPAEYAGCIAFNPNPNVSSRKALDDNSSSSVIKTQLFPSPSDGNAIYEFAIDEKATAKLKMFDFTGKLILSKDVSGTNKYEFKKLNLSEGVYRVQLFVNDELGDEQNMVVVK